MSFKAKFYLSFFLTISIAVVVIDQLLGKLYVRYMILFTSTFFLIGMQFGQRSERRWMDQMSQQKRKSGADEKAGLR